MMVVEMKESERDIIKSSLLTLLCNASGIYRKTIKAEHKEKYKVKLKEITKKLIGKINDNSITNRDIRQAIIELKDYCGCSVGASQKAINVYLKYYSVISNKDDLVLMELDCPIDKNVIKKNELPKISLNNLNLEDYEKMQEKLSQEHTMKILADVKAYDGKKEYK